ncbi:MAG: restriction endonuclease subunit S [Bacteroidetes bacterium]|nr:restriction endonuclease subunit S [Bacteroidota bacterium]
MLEGLEISVILKSKAISITDENRWDSEYFKKLFLKNEIIIHNLPTIKFKTLCSFIKKGIFDLPPSNYLSKGVPLVRTSEIKNPTIDFNSTVFISSAVNLENEKTILNPFDLVFTKIGAYIGDVAMLPTLYNEYNFSQNVAGAKLLNSEDGPFILAFFLSSLGKNQIIRSIMLSGQGKLELDDIRNYEIPKVSSILKTAILEIFNKRELCVLDSFNTYSQAENVLLETIGLKNFNPSTEPINIKSFKDSFLITGRLDAEYYQKKYEEVVEHITTQKHDCLVNLVKIKKSIEPGSDVYSDEGMPFIRVADYNKFGLSEPDKKLSTSFCKENEELIKKLKPKKETILFSKDGSVGTAYMLRTDADFITSGAILHLTVKDKKQIIPEYLTLALNSKLVQMQAERDAGGSIILHWRVGEIENVVVPVIDYKKQEKIAELVEESFKLKKQSEQLLEIAKRAVEIAIEKNEDESLKFIKNANK